MLYIHQGQICRGPQKNWVMYNQIRMCTSKNPQTNEAQMETDGAPDNLRCLRVVAWRSPTLRMKQSPLRGWGQEWQAGRCEPPAATNCLTLAESLPRITSFLNVFCCGWREETRPASLPESVCESWQQLTLSSELGRETWGGHEGSWACVYLHSCTQYLNFLTGYFRAWFQKRKINLHRHLRSLTGARGDLCVGRAPLHGLGRKPGSTSDSLLDWEKHAVPWTHSCPHLESGVGWTCLSGLL